MFEYVSVIILLSLIGFSGFKINEHKDDSDVTKLALYSTALGISSVTVIVILYSIFFPLISRPSRDIITEQILDDFLNPL